MHKVSQHPVMEGSPACEDLGSAGVKRKAVEEFSSDSKENQPSKLPRNDPSVSDDLHSKILIPGKFMMMEEGFEILAKIKTVHDVIPPGNKINVFFVVDDSYNALKRDRDLPVKYDDGYQHVRNKGNNGSVFFQLKEGKYTQVRYKDNICYRKVKNSKVLPKPLMPQPEPNSLIRVSRYYTVLRGGIKRRITAVSGGHFKHRALFEYCYGNPREINLYGFTHDSQTDEAPKCQSTEPEPQTESDINTSQQASHRLHDETVTQEAGGECTNTGKSSNLSPQSPEGKEDHTKPEKTEKPDCSNPESPEEEQDQADKYKSPEKEQHQAERYKSQEKEEDRAIPVSQTEKYKSPEEEQDQAERYESQEKEEDRAIPVSQTKKYNHLSPESLLKEKDCTRSDETREEKNRQTPKSSIAKTLKEESPTTHEDLAMLAKLKENPSVQAVINRNNKPPCVIVYSDKQFRDVKRNLACGSVFGIDCSYKFGDCYVTLTVYQNSTTLHEQTNEPLMYLGPVFLHWDQEFTTYLAFFSHILDKLEDIVPNFEVKLRSDLELSMLKALKHVFPLSDAMVNPHHLKELVNRHLLEATRDKLKTRSSILERIFGANGLVKSRSFSSLRNGIRELDSDFDAFPGVRSYFDKLQLFLYPFICEPQQKGICQELWDNGNDEVLNGLLIFKHMPHTLLAIVERMCQIIQLQVQKLEE